MYVTLRKKSVSKDGKVYVNFFVEAENGILIPIVPKSFKDSEGNFVKTNYYGQLSLIASPLKDSD